MRSDLSQSENEELENSEESKILSSKDFKNLFSYEENERDKKRLKRDYKALEK